MSDIKGKVEQGVDDAAKAAVDTTRSAEEEVGEATESVAHGAADALKSAAKAVAQRRRQGRREGRGGDGQGRREDTGCYRLSPPYPGHFGTIRRGRGGRQPVEPHVLADNPLPVLDLAHGASPTLGVTRFRRAGPEFGSRP